MISKKWLWQICNPYWTHFCHFVISWKLFRKKYCLVSSRPLSKLMSIWLLKFSFKNEFFSIWFCLTNLIFFYNSLVTLKCIYAYIFYRLINRYLRLRNSLSRFRENLLNESNGNEVIRFWNNKFHRRRKFLSFD